MPNHRKAILKELKSFYDQVGPPPKWAVADKLRPYVNAMPDEKPKVEAVMDVPL